MPNNDFIAAALSAEMRNHACRCQSPPSFVPEPSFLDVARLRMVALSTIIIEDNAPDRAMKPGKPSPSRNLALQCDADD